MLMASLMFSSVKVAQKACLSKSIKLCKKPDVRPHGALKVALVRPQLNPECQKEAATQVIALEIQRIHHRLQNENSLEKNRLEFKISGTVPEQAKHAKLNFCGTRLALCKSIA
jgi:hypothetical protein